MPFTIGEATAVNTLLDYILGKDPHSATSAAMPPHTSLEACKAAERLAEKANRSLMAGWSPDRVHALWALPQRDSMHNLMRAVEGFLAEMAATEPGAAVRNGYLDPPAAILLDHLYDCWNQVMREISGVPDAILEPNPDAAVGTGTGKGGQ